MPGTVRSDQWPDLSYGGLAATVDHLHRLVQVAGKYTLDQAFEPGWGNIVYTVAPRGLSTRTLRRDGVTFAVHYRLLDSEVVIEADTGTRTVPLRSEPLADFYAAFVAAAAELGLPAPGSTITCEIPGAPDLDVDHSAFSWDPDAARMVWATFDAMAGALEAWQAPFRGHRPCVGVMWGGFDLSATRYRSVATDPPRDRPVFMQHAMTEEYVAVGFAFGTPDDPEPAVYAYIAPEPQGLEDRTWGVPGAEWLPDAGLAVLPWRVLRELDDPHAAVIAFADAVYAAAVDTAGWRADLVGPRFDGWHASRIPPG